MCCNLSASSRLQQNVLQLQADVQVHVQVCQSDWNTPWCACACRRWRRAVRRMKQVCAQETLYHISTVQQYKVCYTSRWSPSFCLAAGWYVFRPRHSAVPPSRSDIVHDWVRSAESPVHRESRALVDDIGLQCHCFDVWAIARQSSCQRAVNLGYHSPVVPARHRRTYVRCLQEQRHRAPAFSRHQRCPLIATVHKATASPTHLAVDRHRCMDSRTKRCLWKARHEPRHQWRHHVICDVTASSVVPCCSTITPHPHVTCHMCCGYIHVTDRDTQSESTGRWTVSTSGRNIKPLAVLLTRLSFCIVQELTQRRRDESFCFQT